MGQLQLRVVRIETTKATWQFFAIDEEQFQLKEPTNGLSLVHTLHHVAKQHTQPNYYLF